MSEPTRKATLTLDGKTIDLPVHRPTVGPDVLDIRKLYTEADVFTYDPGFTSTAACESAITYIDGDKGELLYRGYPIEQLADKSSFLEVCFLLLYGNLPNAAQLADFESRVRNHTMVHEQMHYFFRGFRRDAHPMATMVGVVGAMSAFYHDSTDISDPWQREVAAIRMIAKLPTIAAMAFKYSIGQPFVYPKNSLDYASNFLHMCFAVPCEDYVPNPIIAKALDRIMMLHADHEQNASTSTVRLAGSSGANPFACIAAQHRRAKIRPTSHQWRPQEILQRVPGKRLQRIHGGCQGWRNSIGTAFESGFDTCQILQAQIGSVNSDVAEDYHREYLWALRFFMAFNRASGFDMGFIRLITEKNKRHRTPNFLGCRFRSALSTRHKNNQYLNIFVVTFDVFFRRI